MQSAAVTFKGIGHLQCQFTGGTQDPALGVALSGVQFGEDRQGKRRGFTGSSLGQTHQILACQQWG